MLTYAIFLILKIITEYSVAQIRVIFTLHQEARRVLFGSTTAAPEYLTYVQWFTPLGDPKPDHGLYQVKRSLRNGDRLASIVPLANIFRSAHLFPVFGRIVPDDWTSDNVLEKCEKFYVNSFSDRHMYHVIV